MSVFLVHLCLKKSEYTSRLGHVCKLCIGKLLSEKILQSFAGLLILSVLLCLEVLLKLV